MAGRFDDRQSGCLSYISRRLSAEAICRDRRDAVDDRRKTHGKSEDIATLSLRPNHTTDSTTDLLTWNEISTSTDSAQYRNYLDKYPDGLFAKLACLCLADLSRGSVSEVTSLKKKLSPRFAEFEETPPYLEITTSYRKRPFPPPQRTRANSRQPAYPRQLRASDRRRRPPRRSARYLPHGR